MGHSRHTLLALEALVVVVEVVSETELVEAEWQMSCGKIVPKLQLQPQTLIILGVATVSEDVVLQEELRAVDWEVLYDYIDYASRSRGPPSFFN